MKRIFSFLLAVLVLAACGTAIMDAKTKKKTSSNNNTRTVYYFVIGSYSSLSNAKEAMFDYPDGYDCCPIFEAKKDGKTLYRICAGIYRTREDALRHKKNFDDYFGWPGTWNWKSNGNAKCAYRPKDYSGRLVPITP